MWLFFVIWGWSTLPFTPYPGVLLHPWIVFFHHFHSPWIILEYGESCGALVIGSGQHIFFCSVFVFLKKRQIFETLQCLYIHVSARVCVYINKKPIYAWYICSSLKFQLLTCWKNWVRKLFLPPGTLTWTANTYSLVTIGLPVLGSITGVIFFNMVEQLLEISPMY